MAKKSSVQKNLRRTKLNKRYRPKKTNLKKVLMDKDNTMEDKIEVMQQMSKLPRNSSRVRMRNRCFITGRPRGYIRKFGISRIAFRDLSSLGIIPGVVKASW